MMFMFRSMVALSAGLVALSLGWATTAHSSAREIGGRISATGNFAVSSIDPDGGNNDTTAIIFGATGAYTTENGRWEFGAGLTIAGFLLPSDLDSDTIVYSPTVQARINSNPLGPEENVLVYGGAAVGLGIVRSDSPFVSDDEVGVFGPKAGLEFYVTPNAALQIEDVFLFDSDGGNSNTFTVGFKLLFK
jgi:hypothetical protein